MILNSHFDLKLLHFLINKPTYFFPIDSSKLTELFYGDQVIFFFLKGSFDVS